MSTTQPGWYPAPDRPGQQRYHDGTDWTDQYGPLPQPKKKGGAKKVLVPIVACLGLGLILVIVAVAAGGGADDEDTASNAGSTEASGAEPTSPNEQGQDTYAVGETGTSSDLAITVDSVEDPWVPTNEFDTPDAGLRYVGVEMTIVNDGDRTTTFSTLAAIEVTDSEGQAWDVALTTSDQPDIGGDIPAGATRKGWVYLQVGEAATGLQMRVKGSFTAEGAVFALG